MCASPPRAGTDGGGPQPASFGDFDFVDDEDWSAGGVDPFAEWDKLDADPDGDDAPL